MPSGRRTPAFPKARGSTGGGINTLAVNSSGERGASILSCIPWMLAGSPGLPIHGCWACLHKVCFLGKSIFPPPHFPLPMEAEGVGNFTRAPSHRQPNPTSLGSPGMREMAPAWLWLQIFVSDPARAHLSHGHAAQLGRGLVPGSMKAHVVHCSRIQMPHSTAPSILYNPTQAYLGVCLVR